MRLTPIVVHSDVNPWFFGPWTDLVNSPVAREQIDMTVPITCTSGPELVSGRGRATGQFVDKPDVYGDVALCLDADMHFTVATIIEMWHVYQQLCETHGPCILGGLAFVSGGPRVDPLFMRPTIWMDDPERGEPFMVQCLNYPRDQLIRVAATGAACIMVHRDVLAAGRPNPWRHYILPDGDNFGEDVSMCRRARDNGYPVFVDSRLKFDHAKMKLVGEADYLPMLEHFKSLEMTNA